MIDIDFETRSKVDIKMGPWRYASDPSTQIMCMAYKIGSRPTLIWAPGDPMPAFVQKRMWDVLGIRAHNAMFERAVWSEICVKRFGWPEIDESQWSCSAAKCAAHSLPRDLQRACMVMNTEVQKDMSGKRVMLKLSKPRKETKNNAKQWHYDIDVPEDFETLYKYCMMDVESEYSLDHAVRDLSAKEQQIWQLDQTINARGICVDTEAVRGAIEIIDAYEKQASPKLARLSDGAFNKVSQVAAIRRWMVEKGWDTESLDKEAVEALLSVKELPSEIREVLHIRQSLGKTSTKKLYAMLNAICPDGRVKDLLMYHGASTGRWCMPGDAEVLTEEFGWRTLDSLKGTTNVKGRSIMVFDPQSSDMFFTPARVNTFAAPEHMKMLSNSLIVGCFTDEHKLPYLTSKGNFAVKKAGDTPRIDMLVSGYFRGTWCAGRGVYFSDDQVRVLLMAQADGHFVEDTRNGRGLRFRFKKERKIKRCKYLLNGVDIPFIQRKEKDGTISIWVKYVDFPNWLGPWCKESDHTWCRGCDPVVFCDELKFWDSHAPLDTSFEFSTTNRKNAEWAQTMGHLAGWFVRVVQRGEESRPIEWSKSYRVYFKRTHTVRVSKNDWRSEERPRDGLVHCPETPTGFFLVRYKGSVFITGNSGKNIQVQNFPRRKVEDLDAKMKLLGEGNLEKVQLFHGDPMDLISSCLRGMIVAAPGKRLYVADYAAIEARGVCWLAGQESTLQLFRDNKDVYRVMASTIYSKPLSQVDGGEKDGQERQLGKQAVLGCLAENTLIYSDTGIKYIQDLGTEDKIWNGKAFVKHGGIKATGEKSVIEVPSLRLTATPDHLILSSRGWRTLAEIVIDGDMTPLKLVRFLDGGRLQDESSKRAQNVMSPCSAVAGIRKALESTNYGWERLKAVIHALNPEMDVKGESQAYTTILSLIHDFAHDGERLGTTLKNVVKTQVTHFFGTMVLEAYRSPSNPVESSWNTLLSWMGTILGISRSIELTRTGGTNEAISAWSLLQKTTKTVQCFDILNVEGGYFQAGNVFAHNCGYSMGPPKFQATCEKYKMQVDLPLAERAVSAYRETNDKVVSMWYEQERAAKTALRERKGIKCGYTKWGVVGKFLYCKLPSGRTLAYPKARLVHGDTPWGEKRAQVEYMGLNTSNQWVAIRTYGGKIVENITQAVCRDIMAEAMLRLEAAGYRILFTVHDEIICETDDNFGSIEEFIKLLTEVPSWAKGFPIKAEGWTGYRYRK